MKKQFVTYEIALKLKELGFDDECMAFYFDNEVFNLCSYYEESTITSETYDYYKNRGKVSCSAPLYQQAFDWFRDEKKLYSWIERYTITIGSRPGKRVSSWVTNIKLSEKSDPLKIHYKNDYLEKFIDYEEARLTCLEKLIELCKKE